MELHEIKPAGATLAALTDGPHGLSSSVVPIQCVPVSRHLQKINTLKTETLVLSPLPVPSRKHTDLGEEPSAISAAAAEAGAVNSLAQSKSLASLLEAGNE